MEFYAIKNITCSYCPQIYLNTDYFLDKRPLVPPRLAGYELCVAAESNDTPAAVSDERLEFVNSTNRKNHLIQGWGEVETNIEMEEVKTNF